MAYECHSKKKEKKRKKKERNGLTVKATKEPIQNKIFNHFLSSWKHKFSCFEFLRWSN